MTNLIIFLTIMVIILSIGGVIGVILWKIVTKVVKLISEYYEEGNGVK